MSAFGGVVYADRDRALNVHDRRSLEEKQSGDAASVGGRGFGDGAGFWFRFLRTGPAPQTEEHPLTLDGRTWLAGDIRLDARDDLVAQLKGCGEHCGPASTDEELVLRAWRCWAKSANDARFSDVLRGEFSFSIWEPEERRLTCFRDLMGARPFFYSVQGDRFCFSNKLEWICNLSDIPTAFDEIFLGDYLLNGWCIDSERTIYSAVRRLAPGHSIEFSAEGTRIHRFATLPIEEPFGQRKDSEILEEYLSLLARAVKERLPTDKAVIFMSGGLDSTTVAAMAAGVIRESAKSTQLHAYTVDLKPLFDDSESQWAGLVAKHIGIPLEVRHDGDQLPFAAWESLAARLPEPRHEPYLASLFEQYREASHYGTVALTGDGGDDILLGNAWPYIVSLIRKGNFGQLAGAIGKYFLQTGKVPPIRAGIRTRFRRLFGIPRAIDAYPGWLNPEFAARNKLRERWELLKKNSVSSHALHPRAYAMLTGPFWPMVLESEEFFCGTNAMQTRAPMMDSRILRFLLRIPPVPWCADKELLRRATKDLLPEAVRRRPKSPVPVDVLQLQLSQGKWSPIPSGSLSGLLELFVDNQKWLNALREPGGAAEWMNYGPLSLDAWLKGVEKRGPIR